jgi:uncharacterized membrane protein (DUF2068 family)
MSSAPALTPSATPPSHHLGLRLIAAFKFFEVLCFAAAAATAFGLGQPERLKHLMHWLQGQSIVGTKLGHDAIELLTTLGPQHFTALGILALAYAALFLVEGIGLWLRKYWAEWLTVFATGSLVPYEAYELLHGFGWVKLAILAINVGIVVYLVRVALQAHRQRRTHTS